MRGFQWDVDSPSYYGVFDSVGEGMTKVKAAGNVGRRET